MSAFKPGDLVWLCKPTYCCGSWKNYGKVMKVENQRANCLSRCVHCGHSYEPPDPVLMSDNWLCEASRIKKIDPPATGETTEAYINIKVPA